MWERKRDSPSQKMNILMCVSRDGRQNLPQPESRETGSLTVIGNPRAEKNNAKLSEKCQRSFPEAALFVEFVHPKHAAYATCIS